MSNTNKKTKMILCKNYLQYRHCDFNGDCKYAHGTAEQQLTSTRKKVYDLINSVKSSNFKVTNEYLFLNDNIEDELLILTKLCKKCQEKTCVGGLNCKMGASSNKYLICKNNFVLLNCSNDKCPMIHLRDEAYEYDCDDDNESSKSSEDNKDNDIITTKDDIVDSIFNLDYKKYDKYFDISKSVINDKNTFDHEVDLAFDKINLEPVFTDSSPSSDSSYFDSDELTYLYESSSSDDIYASIFD